MIRRLFKPWFVYQPGQIARRVGAGLRRVSPGLRPLPTSWGGTVLADPTRAIGRSIFTTGVYDLAVSEAILRLAGRGDTVVDAGANVGYMTALAAVAAKGGRVLSFEPHPSLFTVLEQNATAAKRIPGTAAVRLYPAAVGDRAGESSLIIPPEFDVNDGIGSLAATATGRAIPVQVTTLDEAIGRDRIAVLKIDVEGFELQALRGADRAIADRRITHVVFEDHAAAQSPVIVHLKEAGYRVYSLGWALRGPKLQPIEGGSLAEHYESPSFLATADPDGAVAKLAPRGWRSLTRHTAAA